MTESEQEPVYKRPTLYDPHGTPFQPASKLEETRLLAAGYTRAPRFNPAEHSVEDVQAHLAANPQDTAHVLAAERAGKARTTLTGDDKDN